MEVDDKEIVSSDGEIDEKYKNDELNISPKHRVTFQIGSEDKDIISSDTIDEEDLKVLENARTGSFKRRVSQLMEDKDTWDKLVKESRKNDDIDKDFGTVAKHLLKKSSVYALSQVGHAESPYRRILWILVLVVGIFGCCYQIYHFLTLYFQYPVVINLQVENHQNLEFPAVTICNLNRLKKTYEMCMDSNNTDPVCRSKKRGLGVTITISERRSVASCSKQLEEEKDEKFRKRMQFLTQYSQLDYLKRQEFGHQIRDLIESCSFNGMPCSLHYFSYYQSLKYGNCFTFNKRNSDNDTVLKTASVGVLNGLDIILNLDPENYVPITASTGARVIIHDPFEDPNPEEEGVNISPGYETTLSMKQSCVRRLPAPYKDRCVSYGRHSTFKGNSQNECVRICIQEQNHARCSCIDPTLPPLKNYSFCNMTDLKEACCLDDTLDLMVANGLPCECPLSCFSTTYDIRMFTAVWPSGSSYFESYCDWCTNETELHAIRQKKSRLKISYSSLERKIYEQKPMFQDSELFSHLGGQFGLWLGLSLVAAFELVENVAYIVKYCASLSACGKR